MAFVQNEDYPIEYWSIELAELIAVREGLQRREAHLRILETLSHWIKYYEVGMTPNRAFMTFWKE